MNRFLRRSQVEALQYCDTIKHPALFMEMRLGKTLVSIRYIQQYFSLLTPTLIVAPYSALYSWQQELLLEEYTNKNIKWLTGERWDRFAYLRHNKEWNLINKEGFLYLPEIANKKWGSVIIDESTFLKSNVTQVSQFYAKNFRNVNMRMILSGMPMPEGELNIFQQLKFLDPEILGCNGNFYAFQNYYFTLGTTNNYKYYLTERGKDIISEKLARKCFFMSRKDAGIKEKKVFEVRKIKMDKKTKKVYDIVKREFLIEVNKEVIKVTEWAMVRFIWMRQLCSGFISRGKEKPLQIHENKNNEILDLLTGELKNNQVVIWCVFTWEIVHLLQLLIKNTISCDIIYGGIKPEYREIAREYFQSGKIRVLICQPECVKYGTDLSSADTSVIYSFPLGLETYSQMLDRMIHIEKKSPDLIIPLITEKSIEESIYKAMQKKESREGLFRIVIKDLQNEYE